jgi:4-amino-4-deoxy-L-arabinose transferase-like glycosyltransferase
MADRSPPSGLLTALALALLAFAAAALMAWFVTERLPHLEDEITYLFQARTYARGALWAPAPQTRRAFFTPFVVNIKGRWLGKYAIGWPLVLAVGERLGAGWLVNPLLGALTVVLIFLLARDLFDGQVGLIAGLLALTSPFFLIQSSTYMSHAAAALWATLLAYALLQVDRSHEAGRPTWGWAVVGGLALGWLTLTRALTAFAVTLPYVLWLLARAVRRPPSILALARRYLPLVLVAALIAALQPLYLYLATGSPTTNLYTLVWPYDRLGFGPGIGPYGGHTLRRALITARQDLVLWSGELFGWPYLSWLPILLGVWFGWREVEPRRRAWPVLLLAPFLLLVLIYLAYWIGAQVYGPRYYYEALAGLCVLAAVGLRGATRRLTRREWPVYVLLAALIALNLGFYLPRRIAVWHGVYSITRAPLNEFETLRAGEDALLFVRGDHWADYATFFALDSPWHDGPVVAAHDVNLAYNAAVQVHYPGREVWYYVDGRFTQERPPPSQ